jgi:hypothetical protein
VKFKEEGRSKNKHIWNKRGKYALYCTVISKNVGILIIYSENNFLLKTNSCSK